ncbi:hypothetical protein SERLADRAFT_460453 [Serpula lacrymans var. lacrymans S7.9]|uniref:Uncharacterized protein n=1 Tax=Serpula lacrymans var. lacrymans (strain S7.9) TaxID=578457 RepID=F8NLY7_SERL9|nr:uncharacterized protein SERLADRAFT_460453 [Serpula lacrymans var. lacrymans S7.9]EGO27291.1 hypothetical protein SERLADRAFT_460453 [Serpula lacrymans var. lacrymans S7.9]
MDASVQEDALLVEDKADDNDFFGPREIIEISSDSDDDGLAELSARTHDDQGHDREHEYHENEPQMTDVRRDIIDSGSDSDPDDIFGDRHGHFSEEEGVQSHGTEPEMSEHTTDVGTASSPVSSGSSVPEEIISPAVQRQTEDIRSASELANQWAERRRASGNSYSKASSWKGKRKADSLGSDSSDEEEEEEEEEETRKKKTSRPAKRAKAIVLYDTMLEWSNKLAKIYRKRKAASEEAQGGPVPIIEQKELLDVLKEQLRDSFVPPCKTHKTGSVKLRPRARMGDEENWRGDLELPCPAVFQQTVPLISSLLCRCRCCYCSGKIMIL